MESMLWTRLTDGRLRCGLCAHACVLSPGQRGRCGVRCNHEGQPLSLVDGLVTGVQSDPVEKKPLYHFLPGSRTFSVGSAGCNFSCRFCQDTSGDIYTAACIVRNDDLNVLFREIVRFCSLFHGLSCLLFCCSLLCLCLSCCLGSCFGSCCSVSAGLLEHPAKDAAMIPANNNAAILFFILSLSFFFYLSFISKPGLCQRFHDPIKCLFYRGFRTGDVHPEESLSIRAKGLAAVKSKLHSLNKEFV